MAKITEKRLYAVPSQLLTTNGTSSGQLTVADSTVYVVGHLIVLSSSTQPPIKLKIKRISDSNTIFVGEEKSPIQERADVSAYLVADSASINADEQNRPSVPQQEIERATYAEEPTIARRTILVDKLGNQIDENNPLPVQVDGLSIGTEDGTPTGIQHVFVNNLKSMILASHDRNRDVFYLDIASKKNRRVEKFEYTSATFPGITLIREFNYDLVGTEYVFINDNWNLI